MGANRQTARLRILALGTGRQGRPSVYDFSIVLGLHMVLLLFGAIILVYIARKKPGFKERFRMFIYGYFACVRSEEHTSELQSLMRISYDVFCLQTKKHNYTLFRLTNM